MAEKVSESLPHCVCVCACASLQKSHRQIMARLQRNRVFLDRVWLAMDVRIPAFKGPTGCNDKNCKES